jgi:hypothetical protein
LKLIIIMKSLQPQFASCGSASNGCLLQKRNGPEDDCDSLQEIALTVKSLCVGTKHCLAVSKDDQSDALIWGECITPEHQKEHIVEVPVSIRF